MRRAVFVCDPSTPSFLSLSLLILYHYPELADQTGGTPSLKHSRLFLKMSWKEYPGFLLVMSSFTLDYAFTSNLLGTGEQKVYVDPL
jgi:hypothetical protein